MTPLVSILVPSYNASAWLGATLESALAQTWPACEIIVIDDGSRDGSAEIARGFAARGVRLVEQANAGASAARNHGLRLARGELIQFLDADDLLTPDKIAAQVALLERSGRDGIASCRWRRFVDDPADAESVDREIFRDLAPVDYLIAHVSRRQMMQPGVWLTPRAILDRAGPWDESLSLNDDGEYFARVVLAASRIVFSKDGALLYRSAVQTSLSRRRDRKALVSVARSVELVAAHLQHAEDSPRVRQALADYWQRLEYELYPDAPDLQRRAAGEVRKLGGSTYEMEMGARERAIARVFGWKMARRLKRLLEK